MLTGFVVNSQFRRRRYRQNISAFQALIDTPEDAPFVLPATGLFAIMRRSGSAAVATALTVTGASTRTVGIPAMAVGDIHQIGKLEKGSEVELAATFDLYVNNGIGKYLKIAEGA